MHIHINPHERHWLATDNGLLAPHPSCRECDVIKNLSYDKARGLVFFMNVLSEMRSFGKGKLFADVQIRLISKELQKLEDFEDKYCSTFANQKSIFIHVVIKYSNLSGNFIKSFLS